ncbi:diaminopimelate epimerase [Aeromicrobium sp. Leaf350]|uniref:diaminopimelate epimerase n=1 Tax=Aeromicrobium sp. Leaf350 TaxID=2876565 RepID=UPI001E615E56|nr:diaminopimelate epimerase [Aeromicrobium sp. Leaf350]
MDFTWLKGHGTENDFVLLPDPDGRVHGTLDADFVAALCHRRRGLGADGVMRVVRTEALELDPSLDVAGAEWFMDYRNADGSISEMCGNGVRVFARYLVESGLVDADAPIRVGTRDGVKVVTQAGDELRVDMGLFQVGDVSEVTVGSHAWKAREVHTGNPHAVAFVESVADAGTLIDEPGFDAGVYPEGVNIEFVERRGDRHVGMRVHERGSGETRSCGTGACAVGIATALADGATPSDGAPVRYRVDVPGGTLHVEWTADDHLVLEGPAVIVASGQMEWRA